MESIDLESQQERYKKCESISSRTSAVNLAVSGPSLIYRTYLLVKGTPVPTETEALVDGVAVMCGISGIGWHLMARSNRGNIASLEEEIRLGQTASGLASQT